MRALNKRELQSERGKVRSISPMDRSLKSDLLTAKRNGGGVSTTFVLLMMILTVLVYVLLNEQLRSLGSPRLITSSTQKNTSQHRRSMNKADPLELVSRDLERVSSKPLELLIATLWQESKGNPQAKRLEAGYLRRFKSHPERERLSTSHGLMQVMGATAALVGISLDEISGDSLTNLETGAFVLRKCLEQEKDEFRALQCYNGGPRTKKRPYFPKATYSYAKKVLEYKNQLIRYGRILEPQYSYARLAQLVQI